MVRSLIIATLGLIGGAPVGSTSHAAAMPAQPLTTYHYHSAPASTTSLATTRTDATRGDRATAVGWRSSTPSSDEAGRRTAVTDANGRVTAYGYDQADELTSVLGPDAPSCTGTPQCVAGKAATIYAYDDAGNLTQRIDAKNRATGYQYDLAGRLTRKTDPLGKFQSFTYDADGNPATMTTARGNAAADPATGRVTYTHDPVGRLTRLDYPDATPDVVYTYDDAGRRASMVDSGGTVNYTYDNADRPTNVDRVGGDAWAYIYNPDDQITKRTYPDATVVDATFDRDGNLATVVQGAQTTALAYDEAGRLKTSTLPSGNGHVESRAYDNAGRLTQVKNAKGATTLSQFTRTLDPVGNPTLVATLRGSTTTNEAMQYDTANRLTKWCQAASCTGAAKWISYAYDALGNRSQQVRTGVATAGTTNYTYDNADQLTQTVAGTTTTTSTYDADGNQTAQGTTTFTYDLANRMTSNKIGTAAATNYTYDGDNLRRTRATGTTINTKYSWDTQNPLPELALERNNSNALIRRYVQGPAGPITMATSATATFYYHRDHLGSVTDLTSNTGAAQWRYDYEPYGAQLTATKVVGSAPFNPTRFTGDYLDTELTDYHLRARQYDPATGRFRATDPLNQPLTDQYVSAYAYANNRPGVYTDPSGMCFGIDDTSCNPLNWEWGDASRGAANGVRDIAQGTVGGIGGFVTNPGLVALGAADSIRSTYSDGGITGVINSVNPVYQALVAYDQMLNLANAGCTEEAAAQGINGAVAVVSLIGGLSASGILKGAAKAGREAAELSAEQAANLARYTRKLPSGAGAPQIVRLPDGSVRFSTDVPGRVPGSFARYIKTVDPSGRTTGYIKETYDPSGALVHWKNKFGPGS